MSGGLEDEGKLEDTAGVDICWLSSSVVKSTGDSVTVTGVSNLTPNSMRASPLKVSQAMRSSELNEVRTEGAQAFNTSAEKMGSSSSSSS